MQPATLQYHRLRQALQDLENNPADSNAWKTLLALKKDREVQPAKQWFSKLRKELGLPSLALSERDRTRGAKESLVSSQKKYLAAVHEKADELIPILDRLGVYPDGHREPLKRLEHLANTLASLDEIDLDEKIIWNFTLTGQVDAMCASLQARTKLCMLCLSKCEQIAAISAKMSESQQSVWPRKPEGRFMEWLTDGGRIIPPEEVDEGKDLPFNVIRHHVNGIDLLESAKDCPFCELLRSAIILDCFRQYSYPLDKPTCELPEIIQAIRRGKGNDEFERILEGIRSSRSSIYLMAENFYEDQDSLGHLRVIWQKPPSMLTRQNDRKVVFTKLKVFASGAQQLTHISKYPPLRNSGSIEALSRIKEWLSNCRAHHEVCRDTISHQPIAGDELRKLPKRVIDVGTKLGDQVRLIETSGNPDGHWVALSHCWGKKQNHPPKTTRANLSEHLNAIPLSSLPRTFQDAVVVTRELGLRYLWIDSLCIVQDDEDDWYSESEMMASIYEYAIITLAASSATDSTQGLFIDRPYKKISFPSISLPFITLDEHSGRRKTLGNYSISLEWRQEPFMEHLDPAFTPLYLRGWCTQELILSRRVVHFLNEGMVWVCKRRAVEETGQLLLAQNRHSEDDWATEWGRIITDHSVRNFTFEKDRLTSLRGLATEISKANNNCYKLEHYFYGIWLHDIPECLLWASYRCDNRQTDCPSWSWASCASPVWLRFKDFDNMRPDEDLEQTCKVIGIDNATRILSISAIKLDIGQWDLSLMDRIPNQEYQGQKGRFAYREPVIQGYRVSSKHDAQLKGWIEYDDDRDAAKLTEPVYYLHLASAIYWNEPQVQYWGILIENHPTREGAFKRVGMGSLWDCEFLKTLEREDVAIA